MPPDENMPKWDVALESLARDTCQAKGSPLQLNDFHELAAQHAIRFDDIMETMFLLVIHARWNYRDSSGRTQAIDQQTFDRLYVKRRLSEQDVAAFTGSWEPRQT
jgi:hypothetical protein